MDTVKTPDYERGGRERAVYGPEDVEDVVCPLCGGRDRVHFHTERGALGIVRCRTYDLIYVSPRLRHPEQVYGGDAAKYVEEARLIFTGRAPHHRDPNSLDDLRAIERFKPRGALLDIGTNMGFFLRHTRGRAWDVTGVDPSQSLSELARTRFGLTVVNVFKLRVLTRLGRLGLLDVFDSYEHVVHYSSRTLRRLLAEEGFRVRWPSIARPIQLVVAEKA